jgi:hypothetical protein
MIFYYLRKPVSEVTAEDLKNEKKRISLLHSPVGITMLPITYGNIIEVN